MKKATQQTNAGRITRPDQAWNAAHREKADREARATPAKPAPTAPAKEPAPARHKGAHGAEPAPDHQTPAGPGPEASTALQSGPGEGDSTAPQGPTTAPGLPAILPPAEPLSGAPTAPTDGHAPGLAVPLRFISAALLVAPKSDIRYYLCGVYLHAVGDELRICATDGHRLIVSTYRPGVPLPSWAADGVILNRDQLAQALPIIGKNGDQLDRHGDVPVVIDYEPGAPAIGLRSGNGFGSFRMQPVEGKFPDYARVLASQGASLARGEAEAMRTASIDVRYMRGAADIGSKLGARAVNAFMPPDDSAAALFTFDGAPDTVLIVMAMRGADDSQVSQSVVRMMGAGGMQASVAALRAHITRTKKALESEKGREERKVLEARMRGQQERVEALLQQIKDGPKQLEHREAA